MTKVEDCKRRVMLRSASQKRVSKHAVPGFTILRHERASAALSWGSAFEAVGAGVGGAATTGSTR